MNSAQLMVLTTKVPCKAALDALGCCWNRTKIHLAMPPPSFRSLSSKMLRSCQSRDAATQWATSATYYMTTNEIGNTTVLMTRGTHKNQYKLSGTNQPHGEREGVQEAPKAQRVARGWHKRSHVPHSLKIWLNGTVGSSD